MVKGSKGTQMVTLIWDALNKVKPMEKEYTSGPMVKFMMVSGIKDSSMDMVFGKEYRMTHISENGIRQKLMASEFILGLTETSMRVNGSIA
jgi:hypothetical protein